MKRVINTADAPTAVGAYSQATTNGDLFITAGQLPLTTDGELRD
ncbi:MAG: reactive intermediate/imine deaminase, partial [Halobacteriales archaeon SW_8_66_22]